MKKLELTIFEKDEKVFFLEGIEEITINGTRMNFCTVRKGIVTVGGIDTTSIATCGNIFDNDPLSGLFPETRIGVPNHLVFASEEEATNKCKEINKNYLDKLKEESDRIKKYYPS